MKIFKKIILAAFILGLVIAAPVGCFLAATGYKYDPDLAKGLDPAPTLATNGKTGYVYYDELNFDVARSDEDVDRIMGEYHRQLEAELSKNPEAKYFVRRSINVYEKDGTTVIGQFEILGGIPYDILDDDGNVIGTGYVADTTDRDRELMDRGLR